MEKYINIFLKMKQQASGWPKGASEEEKKKYVHDFYVAENIRLDELMISDSENSGLYNIAKIFLNSLWGKWGQR